MIFEALRDGGALHIFLLDYLESDLYLLLKLECNIEVFLLHVHTSISSRLRDPTRYYCSTVPLINHFAKSFHRAHAYMSERLTISYQFRLFQA